MQVSDSGQLARVLKFRDIVFLTVGSVIGSGIFLVPGAVLRPLGNSFLLGMSVWVVGGLLSLLGALTYGELTSMRPHAGGLYVFIADAFGPFLGFLFGWTLFFVISSGSIATLAVAFSNYLGEFIPLSPIAAKIVSVLMIAMITVVNVSGTRKSANLQNVTTAIKVFAILLVGTVLLVLGKKFSIPPANPATLSFGTYASGYGLAMISVLWAYEGWQYVTFSAGETISPQRNFPLGLLIGTSALIFIYVFANLGYVAALGADGVAASNRVAATALSLVGGPTAAKLLTVAILISVFSAANADLLMAPRVYYAMSKDGLFFKRLSDVHSRFGTPAFAIIAAGVWSAVLAVTGTFEQLLTYVVFVGWIFYALAGASVFVFRKRHPDAERPYKVPGYPLTPLIFILSAMLLVANTVVAQPSRAAVGLAISLAGAPAYWIWKKGKAGSTA